MQLRQAGNDILATVSRESGRSADEVWPRGMKAQKSARYLGLRKQEKRKGARTNGRREERAAETALEQQPWRGGRSK